MSLTQFDAFSHIAKNLLRHGNPGDAGKLEELRNNLAGVYFMESDDGLNWTCDGVNRYKTEREAFRAKVVA